MDWNLKIFASEALRRLAFAHYLSTRSYFQFASHKGFLTFLWKVRNDTEGFVVSNAARNPWNDSGANLGMGFHHSKSDRYIRSSSLECTRDF
jgi:hypothetical protein